MHADLRLKSRAQRTEMDKYVPYVDNKGGVSEQNQSVDMCTWTWSQAKQSKKQHRHNCQNRGAGAPKKTLVTIFLYWWEHDSLHVP